MPLAAFSVRRFNSPGLLLACLVAIPFCAQADRAYVSNEDGETVSVLDTEQGKVIATITVGKRPRGLKLSHDGSRLYAAVSGSPKCGPKIPEDECAKLKHDLEADGIAVIDTAALKLVTVVKAGSDPEQFDLSANGKQFFIANEDAAAVSVVDVTNGALLKRIPVGREPEGVRISPDGRWVLVTNETDSSVSVIDTHSLTVVRTVTVGQRPRDVAFTPDSQLAYVSSESDASLYRIHIADGEGAEKVLQLRKEARPMGVLLDTSRQRLYLSTGRGGGIAVVELDHPRLLTEITAGTRPWGMALSSDARHLYTANGPSNNVSVIDASELRVIATIPVGRSPWGVVLGPNP